MKDVGRNGVVRDGMGWVVRDGMGVGGRWTGWDVAMRGGMGW